MAFPDIHAFPACDPNPNDRNMAELIAKLLALFKDRVPDPECHQAVTELVRTPERWSAGHKVFDEVRDRALAAIKSKDSLRCAQYGLEEIVLKSLYNASDPIDPFDSDSPFHVAGAAIRLARATGLPLESVAEVLAPTTRSPEA